MGNTLKENFLGHILLGDNTKAIFIGRTGVRGSLMEKGQLTAARAEDKTCLANTFRCRLTTCILKQFGGLHPLAFGDI